MEVKRIILEQAERQNNETYFVMYQNGQSSIENYNMATKKTTRIYLNINTTNKFNKNMINPIEYEIRASNKFTKFLIKLGLVKISIEQKENKNNY